MPMQAKKTRAPTICYLARVKWKEFYLGNLDRWLRGCPLLGAMPSLVPAERPGRSSIGSRLRHRCCCAVVLRKAESGARELDRSHWCIPTPDECDVAPPDVFFCFSIRTATPLSCLLLCLEGLPSRQGHHSAAGKHFLPRAQR